MSPPWAIWGLNRGAQLAKMSDPDWPIIVLAPAGGSASPHPPAQQPIAQRLLCLRVSAGADPSAELTSTCLSNPRLLRGLA